MRSRTVYGARAIVHDGIPWRGRPFVRGTIERTPRTLKCYVEYQFGESFAVQWLQCDIRMGASTRHAVSARLMLCRTLDSAAEFRAFQFRARSNRPASGGADRRSPERADGSSPVPAGIGRTDGVRRSAGDRRPWSGESEARTCGATGRDDEDSGEGRSGPPDATRRETPGDIGGYEGVSPAGNEEAAEIRGFREENWWSQGESNP